MRLLQRYLRACADAASTGDHGRRSPWHDWAEQRFHAANVERAALLAAGDPSPPPSILALMGLGA